jgi:hopene-associated glycosyltransferase HpnB
LSLINISCVPVAGCLIASAAVGKVGETEIGWSPPVHTDNTVREMEITLLAVLAFAALLVWVWLVVFRGGFWLCDQRLTEPAILPAILPAVWPAVWPAVVAVIPARDEVLSIADSVRSLVEQDYPGGLTVIVVDDGSSDGTADAARDAVEAATVEILDGAPLADGWTGKVWAMHQGVLRAGELAPEARYVLLTDADIAHGTDSLRLLVAKAEAETLDLVSLMVRLRCESFWEKWLIPAFVFFFQKLYPFGWVNRGRQGSAAAAGGCMLLRRSALDRIGGMAAIRGRVIDDCALAGEIAKEGKIWLGLTDSSRSIRGYDGISGIWNMVARTAYIQLNHSLILLAGTVLGMVFLYLVPPIALIVGILQQDLAAMAFGGAGAALMTVLYVPMLHHFGLHPWRAFLLPGVACLYSLMTISSAIRHYRGQGGAWKGRSYSAPTSGHGDVP